MFSDSIKKGHFLKVHLSKSALSNLFYMKWTSDNFLQYVIIIRIRFGFCLKEQHLIQVGGNKTAARTQYKVFNAAVFLPSINILYFHPLKMHTPNL